MVVVVDDGNCRNVCPIFERLCDDIPADNVVVGHRESIIWLCALTPTPLPIGWPNVLPHKESALTEFTTLAAVQPTTNGFIDKLLLLLPWWCDAVVLIGNNELVARKILLLVFLRFFHLALCNRQSQSKTLRGMCNKINLPSILKPNLPDKRKEKRREKREKYEMIIILLYHLIDKCSMIVP